MWYVQTVYEIVQLLIMDEDPSVPIDTYDNQHVGGPEHEPQVVEEVAVPAVQGGSGGKTVFSGATATAATAAKVEVAVATAAAVLPIVDEKLNELD